MSYLQRINNAVTGSVCGAFRIGWIGDSICISNFLGPTGQGVKNQKLSAASIVSSHFSCEDDNQGVSGAQLASFLPYKSGAVGSATSDFDGQWLLDGATWYWWNPTTASWISVTSSGSSTSRVGISTASFNNLLGVTSSIRHVFIMHSGVNDNQANIDSGAGDFGAHGSYHYGLMLREMISRIKSAGKIPIVVCGTTASDPLFHGTLTNSSQKLVGRYSESALNTCSGLKVSCCDVGLRLNLELSQGRVDILCRNSQYKPSNLSAAEWTSYLSTTGDINAATNAYRVFDETEDYLHQNDVSRSSFWYNLHPNAFGHYLIANEIIKFINENGLR